MTNLSLDMHTLHLKNPVMTASGTFGYGTELMDFFNPSLLGAVVVKAITLEPREGNDYPRMAETPSGMLNAIGLQNKGIDNFEKNIYPELQKIQTHIIANVAGYKVEDYVAVARRMNELDHISAIELNISCPNVKDGMVFGTSCPGAASVTRAVRDVYHKTLIVKLSPNVTDVVEIARAVEGAGADALSMINTLLGMAIDSEKRKPVLSTITGGLSGPAIKPVALRMVWQVHRALKLPIIGMGGIMNASDAIEFFLAGATAIQVGTGTFVDPMTAPKIITGIAEYVDRHRLGSVSELIGGLK